MKKTMLKLMMALAFFVIVATGCKKDGVGKVACNDAGVAKYNDAISAFLDDPNEETCNTALNTLIALAKSCSGRAGLGDLYNDLLDDFEGACDDL